MASNVNLSKRDINVLEKIRDPESNPADAVRLDFSLPKDPHVTDPAAYDHASQTERDLILVMQQVEMELAGARPKSLDNPLQTYRKCVEDLGKLINQYPKYASARNNRAQALRRLYGDDMILERGASTTPSDALLKDEPDNEEERTQAASQVLLDLHMAISLLMPPSPTTAISPTASKTLSLAITQRAAIYYATAKLIHPPEKNVLKKLADTSLHRPLTQWTKVDFEEAASRDFALGGRFGNEIARGLAVGTNPTAKLCGQMVQQMMKNEYGS